MPGRNCAPSPPCRKRTLRPSRQAKAGGLAKPAELNGYPGPRHALDLAAELALSAAQVAQIQAVFDAMNAEARAGGARLIAAERALDSAFQAGGVTPVALEALLDEAEAARAALRGVHLRAHLATAPLLTRHQTMLYKRARGYGGGHDRHTGH